MKARWGGDDCVMPRNRNERSGLAFFRTGIWKMRELRSGRKGELPLYGVDECAVHMFLNASETDRYRAAEVISVNGVCWLKKCRKNCDMKSDVSGIIIVEQ
jgi:hypothetical protein